jgi:hypothetical protein
MQDTFAPVAAKARHQAAAVDDRSLQYVLAACGAAVIAPIWSVRLLPFADLPDHLARAFITLHLHDPAYRFDQFYELHWQPCPNMLVDALLPLLLYLFSPIIAGKIMLSVTLLALLAAAWFFLRQANPGQELLAMGIVMVAYNPLFVAGLVGFHLSLAGCLLLLGLLLKWRAMRPWQWLVLTALTTLIYFASVFGFVVAGFAAAVYTVWSRWRAPQLAAALSPFVPGCVLYEWWKSGTQSGWPLQVPQFREYAFALTTPIRGYSQSCDVLFLAAILATAFALSYRNPEFGWNKPWVAVFCGLTAVYALPQVSGQYTHARLAVFLAVLGLAALRFGRRLRVVMWILAMLIVLRIGDTTLHFERLQPRMAALEQTIQLIPPHSRVVVFVAAPPNSRLIDEYYTHFFAYGVITRGWLTPSLLLDAGRMQPHPLATIPSVYRPPLTTEPRVIDWHNVAGDYEYIWTDTWTIRGGQLVQQSARAIADPVWQSPEFSVLRTRRDVTQHFGETRRELMPSSAE